MRNMDAEMMCVLRNTTRAQLACLNDIKARLYMPVTVFLALLIVVGTLGNVTVCLVYFRRKIRVSSHYFILSLAVLDLITCVIGMPTEMADLILPLTFDSPIACKVLRFLHSSTIIASSTILIEVAFDRYFRICQLGRQFTANKARLLCLGALILGVVFSWPSCVLFGKKTVDIRVNGLTLKGTDCSTDDSMRSTIYPTIYYLFLFSLFGITLIFFTVLYAKIGLRIVGQNKVRAGGAACKGLSPQERLAHVLQTGIHREIEPPTSELSSEHSSHGNSSASGSSGSSGSSCRSTRLLVASTSSASQSSQSQAEAKPCGLEGVQPTSSNIEENRVNRMENDSNQLKHKLLKENAASAVNSATQSNIEDTFQPSSVDRNTKSRVVRYSRPAVITNNDEDYDTIPRNYRKKSYNVSSQIKTKGLCCCCANPQPNKKDRLKEDEDGNPHHQDDNTHRQHHQEQSPLPQRTCNRQLRVGKTTTVLFAVTLAYILSFLPYLTVMVMRSVVKDLEESLSPLGELAYKLCVKSFFINNAINPIIYSFLNQSFRQDATRALRNICQRHRRSRSRSAASM